MVETDPSCVSRDLRRFGFRSVLTFRETESFEKNRYKPSHCCSQTFWAGGVKCNPLMDGFHSCVTMIRANSMKPGNANSSSMRYPGKINARWPERLTTMLCERSGISPLLSCLRNGIRTALLLILFCQKKTFQGGNLITDVRNCFEKAACASMCLWTWHKTFGHEFKPESTVEIGYVKWKSRKRLGGKPFQNSVLCLKFLEKLRDKIANAGCRLIQGSRAYWRKEKTSGTTVLFWRTIFKAWSPDDAKSHGYHWKFAPSWRFPVTGQ